MDRIIANLRAQVATLDEQNFVLLKTLHARMAPLDVMAHRNKAMITERSIAHGREFKPRSTDAFVVTYPKCGTTWVQQIMHGLRSNGSMAFGEITEVVPW